MTWRVEFDHATAFVTGPKVEARRRLAALGEHSPIWVNRRSAWATSTTIANRLLDQIDGRAAAVVEDAQQDVLDLSETVPANQPSLAQEALW